MKLELGRRADYAIRAVVGLAAVHGQDVRRKAADLAAEMDIPVSYVPRILADLAAAGLVTSQPGRRGGSRLARDPATITLREVIEAVDGPTTSTTCVLRGGPCRWERSCAVHEPWAEAQAALLDVLGASTLDQVAARDRELGAADRAEASTDPRSTGAGARGARATTEDPTSA